MRVLSWNFRGFRKATKVQRCKRLLSQHHPDFVYLLETKIDYDDVCSSLSRLGFSSFSSCDAIDKGGGIAIAWNCSFDVVVLDLSPSFCHCLVNVNGNDPSYCITFVYGSPVTHYKSLIWN